jgi:thioredoxin reductase (NADPH)
MHKKNKEVTIIGAGPAGVSAGVYLQRAGFNPVIVERDEIGGLIRNACLVENYPGLPRGGVRGSDLALLFKDQLKHLGVNVIKNTVHRIDYQDDGFLIRMKDDVIVSHVVIVASGTKPRKNMFNVSSILEGDRLFYDLISFNRGKPERVIVIGGGDVAFDYALTLLGEGCVVDVLCRSEPRCLPLLRSRVSVKGGRVHSNCIIDRIKKQGDRVVVEYKQDGEECSLTANYVLVASGREPEVGFLSESLKKAYESCRDKECIVSSIPGLYFTGDVIRGRYRQVGIAVGDGLHAAMLAEEFIRNDKNEGDVY